MMNRPLCGMALEMILGILYISSKKWYFFVAAIILSAIIAGYFLYRKKIRRGIIYFSFAVVAFLCGMYRYNESYTKRQNCLNSFLDGEEITIQGSLYHKEYKNEKYIYYLNNCYAVSDKGYFPCNQIMAYSQTDTNSIGEILVIKGTIAYFNQARNEGNFDELTYYQSKNIDMQITDCIVKATYGKKNVYREYLLQFRERMKQVYVQYLSEKDSGIITTMTLSDKSLLDTEIKSLYQIAGISHILAISGLHISMIGMTLYQLLRKIYIPISGAAGLSAFIMISYGYMTGFGTSTFRAVTMFLIMLLGQWIGRSYESLSALSLSAILLLWDNPFLLAYAGFLFSFAAVLGVVVVGKTVAKACSTTCDKKNRRENEENEKMNPVAKIRDKCSNTILLSYSIQLTTIPFVAYFYYEIPMYSIVINLFVLPLMSILLLFALMGGFLGMKFGCLAKLCFWICHYILFFYKKICQLAQKLPYATLIVGKPEIKRMIFFYVAVAILIVFLWKKKSFSKWKFYVITGCLLLGLLKRGEVSFELDVLDVGQGVGCYVQTNDGYRLFFDGGSTDVSKVGTYRILPFLKAKGASAIDYWVVSHTDSDHISGLMEVLEEGYDVQCLIFSKEVVQDDSLKELLEVAKVNGTNALYLEKGDCLHLGKGSLTCLFPDASYNSTDKNTMSLVVRYEENGFSGIFTGDIDEKAERRMVDANILEITTFYMAAHHGSNGSNSGEFLEALHPEIAVISCGINNSYGHPGEEAMERLENVGSKIFYTMKSGQITVRLEEGRKIIVNEFRGTPGFFTVSFAF